MPCLRTVLGHRHRKGEKRKGWICRLFMRDKTRDGALTGVVVVQ